MNRKPDDKKLSADNDGIIEPKKVNNLDHNAFRSSVGTYPKEIKLFPLELRPILDEDGRRKKYLGHSNDSICPYSDCPRRIERQNKIPRRIRDSQTVIHRSTQVSNRCSNRSDVYRNILGPTPDESILAGLQTFIDICGLADCCHSDSDILGPTPDESILAGLQTFIDICGLADCCHSDSDERIPYGTIIESYALHETNETSHSLVGSPSTDIIEEAYNTASSKSPSREVTRNSSTSQRITNSISPKPSSATPPSARKSRAKEKSPTSRDAAYQPSQSNSASSPPPFTSSKSSAVPLSSQKSNSQEKPLASKKPLASSTQSNVTSALRSASAESPNEKSSVSYAKPPPSQERKKLEKSLQYQDGSYRSSQSSKVTPKEMAFRGRTMAYSTPPSSQKNQSESPPTVKEDPFSNGPGNVSFVTSTPIQSPHQSSNELLQSTPAEKSSITPTQSLPEQSTPTIAIESDTAYANPSGVESSLNNYESAVGEENSVYAPSSDSWCKMDECCDTHGDGTPCMHLVATAGAKWMNAAIPMEMAPPVLR
ncbi:hypothetical protein QE152_g5578 [Popillia japonica]